MIDNKLINDSINQIKESLQSKREVNQDSLYILEDFLPEALKIKLQDYISNNQEWILQEDQINNISYFKRYKINFAHDTVLEESHNIFENLTESIEQIFNKKLKFSGVAIWKDVPGYSIIPHTDNPQIEVSMQIYLSSGDYNLGTVFRLPDNSLFKTPYQDNLGYLMDNQYQLTHFMATPVPEDHVRYSLYVIWTRP